MRTPKISIIIPVYNTEKYLHRCIDSIIAQTFTDFELLLIDDGSRDSSSKICDEYVRKDSRIRVFHKKNGGVSSARNLGILKSLGEYLTFVDSDDYVSVDYLQYLLPQNGEDLVIDSSDSRSPSLKDEFYNDVEAIKIALSGWQILWAVGKVFKKDIIFKHHLLVDECLSQGEDTLYNLNYLRYVSSLRTSSSKGYYYTMDVEGSLSKISPKFSDSIYKAMKVYEIGKQLSEIYNDKSLEYLISKYAGITWTLWQSLLIYSVSERAFCIKKMFQSQEYSSLMENYLHCDESGKKYSLFYWLCKYGFYKIAGLVIP